MTQSLDDSSTLRPLLHALRRRWWVVVVCAVVVPASALAFSLAQQKQYTAEATLLFRDPGLDQKLFGATLFEPSDPDREAATNTELVSLDEISARTARRLDGQLSSDEVRDRVAVASEGQSDLVSVSATDPEPERAANIANTFAQEYILFRRDADRAKVQEAQSLVQRQFDALTPEERNGPRGRSLRRQAEQLGLLVALQTGNAELVQRATAPGTPSSPKTLLNVMVGAVLGLLLGVGLAVILDRLDRRIRDPKEIESIFDRPILATIPRSRSLADNPASPGVLSSAEGDAFRMLRASLRYFNVGRDIRSLVVTSAAPGEGKTTVSWNLAAAAASPGGKVLLIEADLRHPSLASRTGYQARHGLSTVLSGQATLEEAVTTIDVGGRNNGAGRTPQVHVLFAGPLPPNPSDLLESQDMQQLIRAAEEQCELVVIDTPPTSIVPDAIPLLNQTSGLVIVCRLGLSRRDQGEHLRDQLTNLDVSMLGVVVNSVDRGRPGYGYGYGYGSAARDPSVEADRSDFAATKRTDSERRLGRVGVSSGPAEATRSRSRHSDLDPE